MVNKHLRIIFLRLLIHSQNSQNFWAASYTVLGKVQAHEHFRLLLENSTFKQIYIDGIFSVCNTCAIIPKNKRSKIEIKS